MTLRPSDLTDHAIATIAALDRLTNPDVAGTLLRTLHDSRAGIRASRTDAGGGSLRPKGENADPTAAAAGAPDPARQALHDLERLILRIRQDATAVRDLTRIWTTTSAEQPTTKALDDPDLWCAHHLTQLDRCEPATYSTHPGAGTPMRLCRYCYDHARHTGRLPIRVDLERNARGQRARKTVKANKR